MRAEPERHVSALEPVSVFKRAQSCVCASNALQGRACGSCPQCAADRYQTHTICCTAALHFHLIRADINKHSPGFHHLCVALRRQNAARFNRHGKLLQLVRIRICVFGIPMSSYEPLLLVFSLVTDAAASRFRASRCARRVSWTLRTLLRTLHWDLADNML